MNWDDKESDWHRSLRKRAWDELGMAPKGHSDYMRQRAIASDARWLYCTSCGRRAFMGRQCRGKYMYNDCGHVV